MKKTARSWSGVTYDWRRGVIRRRSVPAIIYMLALSIPMAAAVWLADVQASAQSHVPQARTTTPTTVNIKPVAQIQTEPTKSLDYENAQLDAIIQQFVKLHKNHKWSIQVEGLDNDERSAAYKATDSYRSASVFKLLLMYPLSKEVPIDQWSSVKLPGTKQTLAQCVSAMLRVSDNTCGKAVGDYVGWEYADEQLRSIGLRQTNLNNDHGPRSSAADLAFYLHGIARGKWFDGTTRSFIYKTLDEQILRGGIPTGCGSGCAVADKTGDLGFVRHDAGIVRYPGGSYVLSVFTSGASYSDIASLAAQIQAFMSQN